MSKIESDIGSAWKALHTGQLERAEHISLELVESGVARHEVPLAQCWTLRSQFLSAIGKKDAAIKLLIKCLKFYPANPYAQELLIALLRHEIAYRLQSQQKLKRKAKSDRDDIDKQRLILGLGTGRSGSTSFTLLLQAQHATYCSHEHPPLIPWTGGEHSVLYHIRRFALQMKLSEVVADVAHWWLPRITNIATYFPHFRAVVIQRDKKQTVESFLRIKGGERKGALNHWIEHDGSFWRKSTWDCCYPKFDTDRMISAIEKYWDVYYREANSLISLFPQNMALFDIDSLRSAEGQREILNFCGYDNPVLIDKLHANRENVRDGVTLWPDPF